MGVHYGGVRPTSLLGAEAYELITDRTISADLDTLLSVDRSEFARIFRNDLNTKLAQNPIGLRVVRVVIESIHPPVEVAPIYQEVVSAELRAEALIWEAEATAAVTVQTPKRPMIPQCRRHSPIITPVWPPLKRA